MNSSENSKDNCMHSQTSAMVKFICNIYSVSLDISKKYFKMYEGPVLNVLNNIEICTSLLIVVILKIGI